MTDNTETSTQEQNAAALAAIEQWKVKTTDFKNLSNGFKNNEYVLFPREYFSGCDISFTLGNIPVEEIVALEYQVSQQIQPIYGYASFTYDAVMTGTRLVIGSFRINFKETFYIKSVLDKILKPARTEMPSATSTQLTDGEMTLNQLTETIKNMNQDDIKSLAEAYERKLWPAASSKIDKTNQTLLLDPFNGYDYLTKDGWKSNYNKLLRKGFDIVISFGEQLYEIKSNPTKSESGTTKVINGVHITGCKTIYQPTGEAIYEEYTFIGKDTDDTISL